MPIIDVFDRYIVDFHIGLSCTAKDAAQTLQRAMFKRQLFDAPAQQKPIIRSDNGPQFISHNFQQSCLINKVEHERIPCRTPNKNAHIESFNSILENECLSRYEFESYAEAYEAVSEFIKSYNNIRIHSSLKYHTPAETYKLLQQKLLSLKEVKA